MAPPRGDILLSVSGLTKRYPGVTALGGVDFELRRGEVHALVGENGAGKSTLARIVAGLTRPDGGVMLLDGRTWLPATKADAERRGVRIVLQELNLIPTLTVAENIHLRHMPSFLGWIDYRRMNAATAGILAEVGLGDVPPGRRVGELGVGQQQLVEIAAGLCRRCDVLILDEPTAALSDAEIELLFAHMGRLKAAGVGVVYISHRMGEILRIADRITVLRDGLRVATVPAAGTTLDQIIRWMVGRELSEAHAARRRPPGEVAMSIRGLRRPPAVRDVSFDLYRGEILGLAGLMGAGRTETVRAIFGADRPAAGAVYLRGSARQAGIRSPRQAVRHRIALLTEDRKEQGLLMPLSIRLNVTLNRLADMAFLRSWARPGKETAAARRLAEMLSLRCRSPQQPVATLSGGNQQKVILARWLCRDCDVLLFDEPTRGIDVGAKFEIYRLLGDLAGQGKAILVISSDLKELMAICDRIAVMSLGRLVETFARGSWTEDAIMAACLREHMGEPKGTGSAAAPTPCLSPSPGGTGSAASPTPCLSPSRGGTGSAASPTPCLSPSPDDRRPAGGSP